MASDVKEQDVPASSPEQTASPEPASKELGDAGIASMQGNEVATEAKYEWKDQGMQDVPVSDLPDPDDIAGPEDFNHHITYEDAIRAAKEYQQMQPLIQQGYTGDDFSAEDAVNRLDYEHGRRRIYDLYYGNDPIRVDKDGDHYDIISGRHRVFAAKEVGLETVPARVVEKVPRQ